MSYYGSGVPSMLGMIDQVSCPTLFHFGNNDSYIPSEGIDAIGAAIAGRPGFELNVENAGHAFDNHESEMFYNESAAQAAWAKTMAFLATHLPGVRALVRRPGPRLAEGLVTHIRRLPVDVDTALQQWHGYVDALEHHGWEIIEVRAGRLPRRRLHRGHDGRVRRRRRDLATRSTESTARDRCRAADVRRPRATTPSRSSHPARSTAATC